MRSCFSLTAQQVALIPALEKIDHAGFEIRLDSFNFRSGGQAEADLLHLRTLTKRPLLASYRSKPHLGQADPTTRASLGWDLRRAALAVGFEWIDLELDESDLAQRIAAIQAAGGKVVLSHHELQPGARLIEAFEKMRHSNAELLKLIGSGKDVCDFTQQRGFYRRANDRPLIHFYMGSDFAATRVLSLVYGAPFTFVAPDPEKAIAPGQLGLRELQTYRPWEIEPAKLRLFAVIGNPIGHSQSPAFHNPGLKAQDPNALFLAFPCESNEALAELRQTFPELHGLAVTKPMKEPAFRLATRFIDQASPDLGAVNTLLFEGSQIKAANTDLLAMQALLRQHADPERDKLLVLGYGGLGKAVVRVCQLLGFKTQVSNRSQARLTQLPEGVEILPWPERHQSDASIVLQCTALGMAPDADQSPLEALWTQLRLLIETIYNPLETKLMRMASNQKIQVIDGLALFQKQAEIQNQFFKSNFLEARKTLAKPQDP